MSWPFLYHPGDRLSPAELTCARLDGDLVEIGDAYMPADAVETRELRAASLRSRVPLALAATRSTAAWVHGAIAEPPVRHCVQRASRARIHHVIDARLRYRDRALPPAAIMCIGGINVTTPARTLADLTRDLQSGADVADDVAALIAWRPGLAAEAVELLATGAATHFKRPALAYLRAVVGAAGQADVTR